MMITPVDLEVRHDRVYKELLKSAQAHRMLQEALKGRQPQPTKFSLLVSAAWSKLAGLREGLVKLHEVRRQSEAAMKQTSVPGSCGSADGART